MTGTDSLAVLAIIVGTAAFAWTIRRVTRMRNARQRLERLRNHR